MNKWTKLESKRRKLEREKRDLGAKVGEIALKDDATDDDATESRSHQERIVAIAGELNEVETAIDAIPAEQRNDGIREGAEQREFADIFKRASLYRLVTGIVEHRAASGAEAELQAHYGMGGDYVPIYMLRREAPPVETRAVTPGPTNFGGADGDPAQPPIFATGDSAFLNIASPTVPVGEAVYNALTSRPAASDPKSDSTDSGAAVAQTWVSAQLVPKRSDARVQFRASDAVGVFGLDEAMREAVSGALSEGYDQENIDQITADVNDTASTAVDALATVMGRFLYANVDGRHARSESDIRLLVGSPTLAFWGGLFTDDADVVDRLRSLSGGLRTSALIPAVNNNRQHVIVRKGAGRDMVAPMWEGVQIIVDNVTRSQQGEVILTARSFTDRKVIRTDGFARIETRHA